MDLRSGEALDLLDDSDTTATGVVGRCIRRLEEPVRVAECGRTLSERAEIQRDGEDVPLKVDRLLATASIRTPEPQSSGGPLEQRQRINVARALALGPRLMVLEAPVRSLGRSGRHGVAPDP